MINAINDASGSIGAIPGIEKTKTTTRPKFGRVVSKLPQNGGFARIRETGE
jgi:hypothetical protein